MNNSRWPALIALVLALTTVACSSETTISGVDVLDNSFNPQTIVVPRGGYVQWLWRGEVQHNVTFQDGEGSSPNQKTGILERRFSDPGTFRYRCTIYSTSFTQGMTGSVVVQ